MSLSGTMRLSSAPETEAIGTALAAILQAGDVVLLDGPLGAGKTTLTRGLLHGLGLVGEAPSPSYPIVIPYEGDLRLPVWHVDLYRIEDAGEIEELALGEALDGGALIVEWACRLPPGYWPDALALRIDAADEGRCLTWTAGPSWQRRWPPPPQP